MRIYLNSNNTDEIIVKVKDEGANVETPDDIIFNAGAAVSSIIGEIVNVSVDEKILDDSEKIDPSKIHALIYDTFNHGYYEVGNKVGQAFHDGKELK